MGQYYVTYLTVKEPETNGVTDGSWQIYCRSRRSGISPRWAFTFFFMVLFFVVGYWLRRDSGAAV